MGHDLAHGRSWRRRATVALNNGGAVGTFSIWHWIVILFVAGNIAAIVHIAVSDRTRRGVKAAWLIAALLIPYLPYVGWLIFRPSASRA